MEPLTLLIIGIDSKIGSQLANYLTGCQNFTVLGTSRKKSRTKNVFFLDLADPDIETSLVKIPAVDIVLYCAALTNNQLCEDDVDLCFRINADNPIKIVRHFGDDTQHLFLSTNRVFSGEQEQVTANQDYDARSNYGKSKQKVEEYLQSFVRHYTIVRMTKVIMPDDERFSDFLASAERQLPTRVYNNLYFSPISISFVVQTLVQLMEHKTQGIIHLSGQKDVSYAQALLLLCHLLNIKSDHVVPINGDIDETKWGRYSTLDTAVNPEFCNTAMSFRDGFADFLTSRE